MTGPLPCTGTLIILQLCGDLHGCFGLHMKLHCSYWLIPNYFLFLLMPSEENLLRPLVMQELLLGLLACAWSTLAHFFFSFSTFAFWLSRSGQFIFLLSEKVLTPQTLREEIYPEWIVYSQSQMDSSWLEHQNHKAMLINKQNFHAFEWI